jgi:predicted RNase H-like nuclease (RuvC/YqgF family)
MGYNDKELPRGGENGYLKDEVPRLARNVTGTLLTNRTNIRQVDEFREEYDRLDKMFKNNAYEPMSQEDIKLYARYREAKKNIDKLGKALTNLREIDWS